ncbi:MAG: 23S rRNA (uracil(1939)-C(5))-methyltransferase RlmD [bacterium]
MVKNHPSGISDKVELFVDQIVVGGTGLADINGWKVFVPYAAPQERIRARLVLKKKDYGVAHIEDIIEPSPFRVPPLCSYYGECGGCQLQHITYQEQLVIKKNLVVDALQRIGKIFSPVANINFKPYPWRYRNKTQYPIAGNSNQLLIGFYRPRTHKVINISGCLLHPDEFNWLRAVALDAFLDAGETAYDEIKHDGNIRHLVLRRGTEGEILFIIVTKTKHLRPQIVRKLRDFPRLAGIVQNINPEPTSRILGNTNIVHWGKSFITMKILQKELRVSASSFFQVNQTQAEKLCNKTIKAIDPKGDEVVLDLFCGVGMLSLSLANQVRKVIGIEIAHEAVEDARFNSNNLGINNAEFIQGDVDSIVNTIEDADVIIIDPPRKGCSAKTINRIVALSPHTIIYISCNPATLARDLALLEKLNYTCVGVEPLDMFPQTAHVEVLAKVIRK